MTQFESMGEGKEKAVSGKNHQSNKMGDAIVKNKSTALPVAVENNIDKSSGSSKSSSTDSSRIKILKVYRNGKAKELSQAVPIVIDKDVSSWSDVLNLFNESVHVSVQKVFTIKGKMISTTGDLDRVDAVVVGGNEPYKLLSYGFRPSASGTNDTVPVSGHHNKSINNNSSKSKLRKNERASLAKSVILEPTSLSGIESEHKHGSPLMKTFSEQNVSIMEKSSSPKLRVRHPNSTNKARPVSACQHGSMSSSIERRSPLGVSRIPKRIIPSPVISNHQQASLNTSLTVPSSLHVCNLVKSKKIESKNGIMERSSRHDESRREFIRPRLVTVIRHGMKPRKAVRFLLNKKTARSYDQVLNELTESIKPDWGAVRRVYTLNCTEVTCLEDFFKNEDIFLACPNDRLGTNDFDLDSEECKSIQPYVKVSLGIKQSRLRGLEPSRSPQRRPKSCSNSQPNSASQQLPTHPKYIPLSHFPAPILDRFFVGNIIGDGNFAVVRECTNRQTKQRYALKVIDKSKCAGRDAPPEHEVKILSMVNHPNVIEMFEQYDFSNELYIVLELVEGGDLFDVIAEVTKFSENDGASMTRDIASALSFLHARKIIHRDIKPENLLVYTHSTGQRHIKLGDFGLAQIVDGPLYTVCGTPTYVAPEILAESGYGVRVDVWALGVIVYVLLCGYPPFVSPSGEQEDLFDLILSAEYDFPAEHWDTISGDAKDIIVRMIEADADMRLSADEVLDHPWLATSPTESQEKRNRSKQDLSFKVFEAMGLTNLGTSNATKSTSSATNIAA